MSSAVDIQIVSAPNLAKIESYLKDASYRETIEYSANFNTRLCIERRLRLPFLDPQTGVAQNHSHLFVDKKQRMPGFKEGQLYTYPAARWRKSRRQYLNKIFPDRPFQALRKDHEALVASTTTTSGSGGTASPTVMSSAVMNDPDFNSSLLEESSSLGAAGGDTSDSKDSQQQAAQLQLKEELPKEWFYDEMDIHDNDSLEEPKSPADDEYDYDPRYGTKKRRKRKPGKKASLAPGESPGPGRRRAGRGRAAATATPPSLGDISLSGFDSVDGLGSSTDVTVTPTTSSTTSSGRRAPRGTGTRGRRRAKNTNAPGGGLLASGLNSEPPSFESVAAAVGVLGDLPAVVDEHNADLRNYRKYL
ncbi:zinc finger protein ubi-d4 isoform X2 [Stomoxys calcitrans]|uniref:DPF1-3 N-terminal domain-containing protein n=1 Tax=Stomoxys calcitrans TaxID=35570 RepID=A0A1I8Q870_STOCA|nr:zinc finger protein ubi-d4 isoform X2 [Stomoxys calcitrans]